MSGAARRRGQARGRGGDGPEGPPQRGRGASRGRPRGGPPPISNLDGPASQGPGSVAGSPRRITSPGSQGGSRRSSMSNIPQQQQAGSADGSVAPTRTTGLDPALDPDRPKEKQKFTDRLKNVDLPASFYNVNQEYALPTEFTRRPGFNTTGSSISLPVNSYRVLGVPRCDVFQYSVQIQGGPKPDPPRIVKQKVWQSASRKDATGGGMVYDGDALAWSMSDLGPEVRRMVNLDTEQGKVSRNDNNTFRLTISKAKKIDMSIIQSYLEGRIQYAVPVGEAINFLDHLLREGPSQNNNLVPVRRSYFSRAGDRADLGGGIEVFRGVYQSIRLAQGQKLVVNLDVANSCFFKPGSLVSLIVQMNQLRGPEDLARVFNTNAQARATAKYLTKLTVKSMYRGNPVPNKTWKIKNVSKHTANSYSIAWKDPQTKVETGEKLTVASYFRRRYNVNLQMADLPLLEMTKKEVFFPIELLSVVEHQRYASKLNEFQTAAMIKFAVSPPGVRNSAIDAGQKLLNWGADPYLQNYGLNIDNKQIHTQARILPPPGIKFGTRVEQPGTKGRWDLRGKQFNVRNPTQMYSWGIGLFAGRVKLEKAQLEKFAQDFAKSYRGHGGQVANGPPYIANLGYADAAQAVTQLFEGTGNTFKQRPHLMIFIVQNKESSLYLRVKKSCDCRYGIPSQVLQAAQVAKGSPQYISNVLMKVNAKLGGSTSVAVPSPKSGNKGVRVPTMIIGADVSHASPGSEQPSMAAITVSFDRNMARYAAACQTNGVRVEMIQENSMRSLLGPLVQQWCTQVGEGRMPDQVYYFRDGVSEGQFAAVLAEEVPQIRAVMLNIANGKGWNGKITVVIASKRHHIRAFPKQGDGDQKGNPLPGTLIERDVTMPNEWDFFLYSHIALQGTSRPVHYTVIKDEANHAADALQNMIYEHCYQYMRSTTSVSLHPAVYYAHLASNRAKAHEDIPASAGPQGGPGFKQNQPPSSSASSSKVPDLIKMNNRDGIWFSMWYI